jgi:hypothetical protein
MPAFVRTKSDEARWSRAKEAAGKETDHGSEGFWKLSNYIYHKMGKTENDQKMANFYKTELLKFGGMMQLGLSEKGPKAGANSTSVKIPKAPRQGKLNDKPSVFFKAESCHPKHPSTQKLYDFMAGRQMKKCGCGNL